MNSLKIGELGTAVAAAAVAGGAALGHGSLADPPSRIYSAYLEGPETPQSDAVRSVVELGGTQQLYDWNELVAFHPGDADYQRSVDYAETIPNGMLASAGNPKYAAFDQVRDDWPASAIDPGPYELTWFATTPHDPSVFRAFITTEDWDPSQPLNWQQMEALPLGPTVLDGNFYTFNTILPERSGRHAIYVIWQRIDPVGEGFYAVADVDFGEPRPGACSGDLDGDGFISGADLSALLGSWGPVDGACDCDLDGDGMVGGADLSALLGNWGLCGEDCNGNGVEDGREIADGAADCNVDGIPDECQVGTLADCNANGVPDVCELVDGTVEDCDRNGRPDACDFAEGGDADGDGVLDACFIAGLTWSLEVTNDWGSGFVANLTVYNDSNQCLSGWNLEFDADFVLNNVWNGALVSQEDGHVRLVNEAWNGNVCDGKSFTVGFEASGPPTGLGNVTLNDSVVNPAG